MEYDPVDWETALTVRLVAILRALTVTSGIRAWDVSRTVPVMAPKICWARDGTWAASTIAKTAALIHARFKKLCFWLAGLFINPPSVTSGSAGSPRGC